MNLEVEPNPKPLKPKGDLQLRTLMNLQVGLW